MKAEPGWSIARVIAHTHTHTHIHTFSYCLLHTNKHTHTHTICSIPVVLEQHKLAMFHLCPEALSALGISTHTPTHTLLRPYKQKGCWDCLCLFVCVCVCV